jgi:hypothetical protein
MTPQQREEFEREFLGGEAQMLGKLVPVIWTSKESMLAFIDKTVTHAREEERQFILNVLDGIDIADREMGNTGGGTKAIRLTLQSRIITPPITD